MSTTNWNINYPRCDAKQCWGSIDAHSQDVAGSMSLEFFQWMLSISAKWMSTTVRNLNYPRCKAKTRWRFVDAHAQDVAGSMSLSLLLIKATNISVMHHSAQIVGQLPNLQNHASLTLCRGSGWCIVHSTSAAIDNCFHYDLNILVVFLADWDLALWQSRVH